MDPRPFHFQYRRPRVNNPTYQSLKLYESIYQLDKFRRPNPQNSIAIAQNKAKGESEQMRRHQSSDIRKASKMIPDRYANGYINGYGQKDAEPRQKLNSSLSQYGNNIMNHQMLQQNRVYEKQQKNFNIINMHPKNYTPSLKNYPRITVEHKLLERSSSSDRHQ